ncbi:MAG: YceI family protein [Caulobacteraceae bacterium]|nr:YceI family protein [Caulobacteraceae bacterium]
MKPILIAITTAAMLAACSPPAKPPSQAAAPAAAVVKSTAPAGLYTDDPIHTSINFRIGHLGLSHFTARFTRFHGTLQFDPDKPSTMAVDFTLEPASLQTNYPDPKALNFDKQISGEEFLDAGKFPVITFKSTKVEATGANTAKVTGDFTLHGVTRPVVLDAVFNGGYAAGDMDPSGARIGFSATTRINRSDYGISFGIPAPGSTMGVSDEIDVAIESEWTYKPPGWKPPPMPVG